MLAIIALNIIFAAIVVGGIVGLLARSVWTSRADAAIAPAHTRAARPVTRRRLVTAIG